MEKLNGRDKSKRNPDDDKLSDREWETEKPGVERAVKRASSDNTR